MNSFVLSQTHIFFIFVIYGLLIALLFDIFRILRKSFKTPDIVTYIEDVIFWLLTCIILAFGIFKYNNGELRAYIFIGLLIGLAIYLLYFSKTVIKVSVTIITTIKKCILTILEIIAYPLKIIIKVIRKIILKPISFIFINIHKSMSISVKKYGKILQKGKIKEGFKTNL